MVQKRSKTKSPLDDWKALGFKPDQAKTNKRDWKATLGICLIFSIGMMLLIGLGLGLAYLIFEFVPGPFRWPLAMAMLLLPPLLRKKIIVLKPFVPKARKNESD